MAAASFIVERRPTISVVGIGSTGDRSLARDSARLNRYIVPAVGLAFGSFFTAYLMSENVIVHYSVDAMAAIATVLPVFFIALLIERQGLLARGAKERLPVYYNLAFVYVLLGAVAVALFGLFHPVSETVIRIVLGMSGGAVIALGAEWVKSQAAEILPLSISPWHNDLASLSVGLSRDHATTGLRVMLTILAPVGTGLQRLSPSGSVSDGEALLVTPESLPGTSLPSEYLAFPVELTAADSTLVRISVGEVPPTSKTVPLTIRADSPYLAKGRAELETKVKIS